MYQRHACEVQINPGKEEEALEAFKALVAPTHGEDGCILYALHRGVDDRARLTFIERWESRELLDAHLDSDHVAGLLQRADELWGDNGEITVYEAVRRASRRRAHWLNTRAAEPPAGRLERGGRVDRPRSRHTHDRRVRRR